MGLMVVLRFTAVHVDALVKRLLTAAGTPIGAVTQACHLSQSRPYAQRACRGLLLNSMKLLLS